MTQSQQNLSSFDATGLHQPQVSQGSVRGQKSNSGVATRVQQAGSPTRTKAATNLKSDTTTLQQSSPAKQEPNKQAENPNPNPNQGLLGARADRFSGAMHAAKQPGRDAGSEAAGSESGRSATQLSVAGSQGQGLQRTVNGSQLTGSINKWYDLSRKLVKAGQQPLIQTKPILKQHCSPARPDRQPRARPRLRACKQPKAQK